MTSVAMDSIEPDRSSKNVMWRFGVGEGLIVVKVLLLP
jgi:hypothetical protein